MVIRFARRVLASSVVVALGLSFNAFPSAAHAADAPVTPALALPAGPLPSTVSADALPTTQINGVVWKQVIVGNTVFAGGEFTNARPAGSAPGVNTVPRSNLLAYDIRTGVLNTSFAPVVNGKVKDLAVTPDGTKLIAVGGFTQVNGKTRNRAAVFNITSTGATLSDTVVPNLNGPTDAVAATNTRIYFGGSFSALNGTARVRIGAVSASDASLVPGFSVHVDDGSVKSIVISPDGNSIVFGGNFQSVGGSNTPGYGLARVDAATGAMQPLPVNSIYRDGGPNAGIVRLATDGSSFYGVGWVYGSGGNSEGTFQASWSDGNLVTLEDCHGDTYDVAPIGDVVYTASHKHYCGNSGGFPQTSPWTTWHSTAWTKSVQGVNTADKYGYPDHPGTPRPGLLPWFPKTTPGTYTGTGQATWTVTGNSQYVLYGGEFTYVNDVRQQGLVRYAADPIAPEKDGPRTTSVGFTQPGGPTGSYTFAPGVKSFSPGTARVTWPALWDRDDGTLTYQVFRDSTATKVFETTQTNFQWDGQPMRFDDTGLTPGSTVRYAIRVLDPNNNMVNSSWVTVTVASTDTLGTYADAVVHDGATKFWRLSEPTGTTSVSDWAGTDDTTAGAGVTRGTAGALDNMPSETASSFDGTSDGVVISKALVPGPNTFSEEVWFKTSSTSGGKIAGFGNGASGNSSNYDRHIYMDGSGRVLFGVYNGATSTVQSGTGLNDDHWHQAVATMGPDGMALYVDGTRVGSRTDITTGQDYSGYWRIGGDSTWSDAEYLTGAIDEFSVYPTALTPTQVDHHWVASGRSSTRPAPPADAQGKAMYDSGPDMYWRLGETAGTTAVDSANGTDPGTYLGANTKGQTGLTGVASDNKAVSFTDGTSGNVVGTLRVNNPTTFSQEVWIKTAPGYSSGGRIFGFGDSDSEAPSSSYDRMLYMLDSGKVRFGVYNGNTVYIDSNDALNDGGWHQLVSTLDGNGMKLYVDGQLNSSDPNPSAQDYAGYWKLGGDNAWGGNTNSSFVGTLDEAAVYPRALPLSEIRIHYLAAGSTSNNVAPTAAFTSSSVGLKGSFNGSGSTDSDGTISSYGWDFGDGNTGTGATPDHVYTTGGTYQVALTVTDDQGATATVTHPITVTQPKAAFTSSSVGLKGSFDGSGSTDPGGTIVSYSWDFGDASAAGSGAKPDYVYASAGTYTVQLTVTDDQGATGTVSHDIIVAAPASNVLASDAFARTVAAGGWGSADVGGAWTIRGVASRASVSGGSGKLLMPSNLSEYADLNGVSSTSTRVTTEFSVDKLYAGTASGYYVGVVGRQIGTTNSYTARLVIASNGSVKLYILRNGSVALQAPLTIPGLTIAPNTHYKLSVLVTGTSPTTVSAKVWKAADTEPVAWQRTGPDSLAALQAAGGVGVFTYMPGGSTNTPVTVSFHSFIATKEN